MFEYWAHRGSHGETGPLENTLEAFELAVHEAADGVELDVHLSADGVAVVFHDEALRRLAAAADDRLVAEVAWSELRDVTLLKNERIPRLETVLAAMKGRMPVNIEVKDETAAVAVVDCIRRTGFAPQELIVSSFSLTGVKAFSELGLGVRTAWINGDKADALRGELDERWPFLSLAECGADRWHPRSGLVTEALVREASQRGIDICCWTVNDPAEAQRLRRLGVAGVFTDRPAGLRSDAGPA